MRGRTIDFFAKILQLIEHSSSLKRTHADGIHTYSHIQWQTYNNKTFKISHMHKPHTCQHTQSARRTYPPSPPQSTPMQRTCARLALVASNHSEPYSSCVSWGRALRMRSWFSIAFVITSGVAQNPVLRWEEVRAEIHYCRRAPCILNSSNHHSRTKSCFTSWFESYYCR